MIIERNPEALNPVVTVNDAEPSKLVVESFQLADVTAKKQTFDLTEYQGGPFRLYVERDGSFSTDPNKDHYWLLVEAIIPERQVESVNVGTTETGESMTELVEAPLDLHEVEIIVFELPQ